MNIPKYVGVVYDPAFDDEPHATFTGDDESAVTAATLSSYNELVATARENGEPESYINEIGWDIYSSTRASANSPDAIHGKFEGPGA